jgi:hypothetical protein
MRLRIDTFPDREGYNIVEIYFKKCRKYLSLTLNINARIVRCFDYATSCDHLRWAGNMTAQGLSRAFFKES